MKPSEVDDLSDEMWAAMVERMQREAAAIEKSQTTTKLPGMAR
jgi:hypothetical protein